MQCTVCSVKCALCNVQCAVCSVECLVCIGQCKGCIRQCWVIPVCSILEYFKQAAVHSVKFSVCSGYSAIYSLKYTVGSVQHAECAVCCI